MDAICRIIPLNCPLNNQTLKPFIEPKPQQRRLNGICLQGEQSSAERRALLCRKAKTHSPLRGGFRYVFIGASDFDVIIVRAD